MRRAWNEMFSYELTMSNLAHQKVFFVVDGTHEEQAVSTQKKWVRHVRSERCAVFLSEPRDSLNCPYQPDPSRGRFL
jgi:hypothetical protein